MADLYTVGLAAQAASGALILLLGVILVALQPARRYTVSFGFFLGAWGGLILLGNGASLVLGAGDPALARTLMLGHLALLGVAYLPLAHFVLTYPASGANLLERPLVVATLLVPAVAGGGVMLINPGWVHQGFTTGGTPGSIWGPAYPLFAGLFLAGLYAAIACLHHHHRTTELTIERRRTAPVLLALGLYGAFEAGESLVLVASQLGQGARATDPVLLTVGGISLVGLVVLAHMAWSLGAQLKRPGDLSRGVIALAIPVPLVFGAVSGLSLAVASLPPVLTLGLWRLGAVALLVYAVLRFELPALEGSFPRLAATAGLGLVALVGVLSVYGFLSAVTGSTLAALVASQGLLVLGALVVLHRPPGWLRNLTMDPDADVVDIYEAALAKVAAGDRQAQGLDELRQRLALSQGEHDLVARLMPGSKEGPGPLGRGTRVAGRYRMIEEIGRGGAGRALLARDEALERDVVLKQIQLSGQAAEAQLRAFLREARVTAGLEHPNVVAVHDVGYAPGGPFVVLEYMGGGSLTDRLAGQGPLSPGQATGLVLDVLAGLAHLHEAGLLHRDLKPSNVLLTSDGVAKVADLGLAFAWQPEETQQLLGGPGQRVGTPSYMAPEQLLGRPVTPRTDLYAAGAILYEALTGEHYLGLEDPTPAMLHHRVTSQAPRLPCGLVPEGLEKVCRRALAKEPEDRYPSASAMREALLDALGAPDPGAKRSGKPAGVGAITRGGRSPQA